MSTKRVIIKKIETYEIDIDTADVGNSTKEVISEALWEYIYALPTKTTIQLEVEE